MRTPLLLMLVAMLGLAVPPVPANAASPFTLFETGQVRPLAQSPDGTRLFAVNTPDNRLEIFDVAAGALTKVGSAPVGLEPIAVAARSNSEVWVVNHLSDSISIVDVSTPATAHVVRTLLVGDEPRDIVFAGPGGTRAFVTTAHRGQNTPLQATISTVLSTPGIGRADVWVFDANDLGTALGGTPLTIVTLFGDTPRALAVSPDGTRVYAAVFHSGNQTTTITEGLVPNGGVNASGPNDCSAPPGGLPPPNANFQDIAGPEVGLIVKFDGAHWRDELGRCWDAAVRFSLPDKDVFAIDASANPPVPVAGPTGAVSGVGTILFNMAVNPVSGKVYVSNLESFNRVRFEGAGNFSAGFKPLGEPASVRGHLAESRITVLDGGTPKLRRLNKHIDYSTCCAPIPNAENDASIAFPLGMAVSSDGATLYVAGFGSSEVGVYSTSELENDTFVPSSDDQLPVSGGGPTGLVLDEARSQLYVFTRFDNAISILATGTGEELLHLPLFNPEPASVVAGRPFLYDATVSSSHGDSACASCHIFGDFDSLAWDLGDPDGTVVPNPGPFAVGPFINPDFHPMKGPMTTQSLRGMANHGPMHWRGDRTGGNEAPTSQPDSGTFDEDAAFKKFNPAFPGLIGRSEQLTTTEMQEFTDFILQVSYPPNPIRNLDNSLTSAQQAGHDMYFGAVSDTVFNCNGCHRLDPSANPGVAAPGFFGTDGRSSFEGETQILKIPQLRNVYQKVGMFGLGVPQGGGAGFTGDQVRGFGFLHDGSVDTLFRFHSANLFTQSPEQPGRLRERHRAAEHGRVHDGLRLEPRADRGPTDHPHGDERRDRRPPDHAARAARRRRRVRSRRQRLLRRRAAGKRVHRLRHVHHRPGQRAPAHGHDAAGTRRDTRTGGHVHLRTAGLRDPHRDRSRPRWRGRRRRARRRHRSRERCEHAEQRAPGLPEHHAGHLQACTVDGQARHPLALDRARPRPILARRPDHLRRRFRRRHHQPWCPGLERRAEELEALPLPRAERHAGHQDRDPAREARRRGHLQDRAPGDQRLDTRRRQPGRGGDAGDVRRRRTLLPRLRHQSR